MTLEEIAKIANVSRSTVSRVLNNHPHVRSDVRQRVMGVVEERGYAPNAAARSLVTKRTNIVGMLLPQSAHTTFTDPFFGYLIPSVTEACVRHKRYLMLSMINREQEEEFYRSVLRSGHMDGLIVGVSIIDDPILPQLVRDNLPLVLLGQHPYYPQTHWVDIDNRQAALGVVEYLIQRGRRRIAFISMFPDIMSGIVRRKGYMQALLGAQLPADPALIIETDGSFQGGQQAIRQLAALETPPDAIFAANDPIALGALAELRVCGYSVPDDIALVGFDDQPTAALSDPPLTTVHQPIDELGRQAVELLVSVIDGKFDVPQHITLPTQLIERGTA